MLNVSFLICSIMCEKSLRIVLSSVRLFLFQALTRFNTLLEIIRAEDVFKKIVQIFTPISYVKQSIHDLKTRRM